MYLLGGNLLDFADVFVGEVWIAGADEKIGENETAEVISVTGTKLYVKKKE